MSQLIVYVFELCIEFILLASFALVKFLFAISLIALSLNYLLFYKDNAFSPFTNNCAMLFLP